MSGSSGSSGLSSGLEMPNVSKSRTPTSQIFTTFAEDFVVSKIRGKKKWYIENDDTAIQPQKFKKIKSYDILQGSKVPGDFPKSRCMCRKFEIQAWQKGKRK